MALVILAFVLSVIFSPCVLAGEPGPAYLEDVQEILTFKLTEGVEGDFQEHEWNDGENLTVQENDQFIYLMVEVSIEKSNASNNYYAAFWTKVGFVIKDPNGDELENVTQMDADPDMVVDDGDRWLISHYYLDLDVTADTSGNYSIIANYSMYHGGEWKWAETSITYFSYDWAGEGEGEEAGPSSGSDSWQWLDAGGLIGILGTLGFFGMIGSPALFVYAAKHGSSKFECLVYLIMAELVFFVLFIIGS